MICRYVDVKSSLFLQFTTTRMCAIKPISLLAASRKSCGNRLRGRVASLTIVYLVFALALTSFRTDRDASSIFECSERAPFGAELSQRTLKVQTPSTGRLGNHMRFYRWAIYEAIETGCHVALPVMISNLNLSSSCPFLRNTKADDSAYSCRDVHEIADFDDHTNYKHPGDDSSGVMDALRKYTSSHESRTRRSAYGVPCPRQKYAAIQLRSGDTFRGSFDPTGSWKSAKTYRVYTPFPTSYYIHAFKSAIARFSQVVVICERPANMACSFFQKLEILFEGTLHVRYDGRLLDDLHDLACSSEVVVSRGSFHESFNIHSSQIMHDFSDKTWEACSSNSKRVLHFSDDPLGPYRSIAGNWNNTSVQHNIVDKVMSLRTCI